MNESENLNTAAEDTTDLIGEHRPWLQQVIARRVGTVEAVADVMSEVALAVLKSSKVPEGEADFAPWLCKIAIRQSALFLRKQSRNRKAVESFANEKAESQAVMNDPIYWLLSQEKHEILRAALMEIAEEEREILVLKYQQKLTYRQIGQRLCIAVHVAEYRLAQAKKHLRGVLIARGLGVEDLS